VKGRIEEPAAVREERALLQQELSELSGERRDERLREMSADPLATEAEPGIGKLRIPFGPFLAVAIIEYLFFGEPLLQAYLGVIGS
jgi:leader peptidase (prepilin peptidase)/N-methyltransferase